MKIAMFHELHQGGAQRAVLEIGKRLNKKFQVDLYVSGSKISYEEKKAFRKTYSFPFVSRNWKKGDWKSKLYKDTLEYLKLLNHHKAIADKINKGNYDIVFVHPSQFTQAPFVLLFIKKVKIYYCQEPLRIVYDKALNDLSHVHGAKKAYELLARLIRRIIDRVNLSRANVILCNSKYSKENIKKAYGVKAKVRYLGVDHNFFSPKKLKKTIDVLYFGSHERIEMYEMFREAVKRLPKNTVVVEHFPGDEWVTDEDLRDKYRRARIVVTLHKNEPFGLIPIETSSCAVPVIALDSGGHKESIINGTTGFLVSDNWQILAKSLLSLLKNPKRCEQMGRNGRINVITNWTWDKNVKLIEKELLKLYE